MPRFNLLKLLHISKIIHNSGKSRKRQAHMLYSIHTHFSIYQTKCIFTFFSNSFKYILPAIKGNQVNL